MTKNKKRLLAIDGVEARITQYLKNDSTYIAHLAYRQRVQLGGVYQKAVWVDAQLNGSCIVDPFFVFHFYEEEDAMAYKLKWS